MEAKYSEKEAIQKKGFCGTSKYYIMKYTHAHHDKMDSHDI